MTEVVFSKRAEREADRLDTKWRADRPYSPDLFALELAEYLTLVETSPELVGELVGRRRNGAPIRRGLLEQTAYHVYYSLEKSGVAVILSIWRTWRGTEPKLK